MELKHDPVMLKEVMELCSPQPGETVLDVTLGLGGHAKVFAEAIGEQGSLIGLDADEENLQQAEVNLQPATCNLKLHHVNFSQIGTLDLPPLDIIFADLGLSSPHIDDAERGFSFQADAPLDLRFDRTAGKTAAQRLEKWSQDHIREILAEYAEMPHIYKLAEVIKETLPKTTGELRTCVEQVCGYEAKKFLPQVFQAFRIAVNDEMGALKTLLKVAPTLLKPNGRMAILTYHSLEDRMVKHTFRELTSPIKDEITGAVSVEASYELLTPKPIMTSEEEIDRNPRSRSAKLRAIRRVKS